MPRNVRIAPGGLVYHVVNRGFEGQRLFFKDGDYNDFERDIAATLKKCSMRILAYCLLPNHWHFVLWPERDGDLAAFMQRLTVTHATRWRRQHDGAGDSHVYQSRFKSFPVDTGEYVYQVVRHVESNPWRNGLVRKAEDWPWSSLWIREFGEREYGEILSPWPQSRPRNWLKYVNGIPAATELEALGRSCQRGTPYGQSAWVKKISKKLRLESTLRDLGRPRKA